MGARPGGSIARTLNLRMERSTSMASTMQQPPSHRLSRFLASEPPCSFATSIDAGNRPLPEQAHQPASPRHLRVAFSFPFGGEKEGTAMSSPPRILPDLVPD